MSPHAHQSPEEMAARGPIMRWHMRRARLIYAAYPDVDLLPIDPPHANEPMSSFMVRAEHTGDALFLFLCREANDEISAAEYVERLDTAIRDIEAVRAAVLDSD